MRASIASRTAPPRITSYNVCYTKLLRLEPFYRRDLAEGRLTRERAKELLSSFWIKVNNTPAPPKVGVTAAESGTYNDFTNINLGGLSYNFV